MKPPPVSNSIPLLWGGGVGVVGKQAPPQPTATPPLREVGSLGEVYGWCLSNTSRASKPDKQRAHGQLTGGGRCFCEILQIFRKPQKQNVRLS